MVPSFDLAKRGFCRVRWLPEHRPDTSGAEERLSLPALLLHAHEIEDVEVSPPPALSGLLRVLAVLTGRVTGLDQIESYEEWEEAREDTLRIGRFDAAAIRQYFADLKGRFELFHTATEYPFLQDKRLLQQCRTTKGEATSSGVNKLVLDRAAGQAFVWQSHTVDADPTPVPVAEAVLSLLAWLYYGPPGRCTARQVGEVREGDTKAGPLRGSVSFHPVGSSLFHTLMLGLPYIPPQGQDTAPWEEEPRDPLGVPPAPKGLARVLTGRFRHAVLLSPSDSGDAVVDARITWAWRQEHSPAKDPYLMHRLPRDGGVPVPESASAQRAVWRDLDALLGKTERRRRPAVFTGLDELAVDEGVFAAIRALGFDQDRSQVKDRQYFVGTTPPLLDAWKSKDPERWTRLLEAREAAEKTGWQLENALSGAWRELTGSQGGKRERDGGVPWLHTAMMQYWEAAEQCFWETVRTDTPSSNSVSNKIIKVALQVYDRATDAYTRRPEQVQVVENHRGRLWRGWRSEVKTNGAVHA